MILNSLEELIKVVLANKYRVILLQAPNGLRNKLIKIYDLLKERLGDSTIVIIDGERRFGGCDLPLCTLSYPMNVDAIIHIGHRPFPSRVSLRIPSYYLVLEEEVDLSIELLKEIKEIVIKRRSVCFLYPPQYKKVTKKIIAILFKSDDMRQIKHIEEMEVLGCEREKIKEVGKKVEAFMVVSPGLFYGLGPAIWTDRETYIIDLYKQQVVNMRKYAKKYLSLIAYNISKIKDADNIGVIIVLKSGQFNFRTAMNLKRKIEKLGKRVYLITMEELTPEKLRYFIDIDLFIQTGCPRISIDNLDIFDKPVLNVEQALIALGEIEFTKVYGNVT